VAGDASCNGPSSQIDLSSATTFFEYVVGGPDLVIDAD
jgi:hypothetical protein